MGKVVEIMLYDIINKALIQKLVKTVVIHIIEPVYVCQSLSRFQNSPFKIVLFKEKFGVQLSPRSHARPKIKQENVSDKKYP